MWLVSTPVEPSPERWAASFMWMRSPSAPKMGYHVDRAFFCDFSAYSSRRHQLRFDELEFGGNCASHDKTSCGTMARRRSAMHMAFEYESEGLFNRNGRL